MDILFCLLYVINVRKALCFLRLYGTFANLFFMCQALVTWRGKKKKKERLCTEMTFAVGQVTEYYKCGRHRGDSTGTRGC